MLVAAVTLLATASVGTADAARASRTVNPTEADFWVMTTGGISFHPCRPIVLQPNVTLVPDEHKAAARAQLAEVVRIYNDLLERPVFAVGADTTAGWTSRDGRNVVQMEVHGDPNGSTNVARYASGRGRVVATGTVDGHRHVTELGALMDLELNPTGYNTSIDTFVHEVAHGLGFHHTIDGTSIMSYSTTRRHYFDSLDDERRWGAGFLRGLRALFPADCAAVTLGLRHDWRKGGPDKGGTAWFHDTETVVLSDGVDTVLEVGTDLVDGPGLKPWEGRYDTPPLARLVLCRDDLFADCLGGSALAGTDGAVAFVPGGPDGTVDDELVFQLLRNADQGTEVVVLGGPNAVSPAIEERLREELEFQRIRAVTRIAGEPGTGRYGTAVAIADRMLADGASDDFVLLARSDNPVDAVAAGAYAARHRLPILLTEPGRLTDTTEAWLAAHAPPRVAALGGPAAIAPATFAAADAVAGQVERVSGPNRRATSVAIARHPWLWQRHQVTDSSQFWFVNGEHPDAWALALASAPWAARERAPILLVEYDHLGFTADGSDRAPDPGWYLWSLTGVGEPTWGESPTGWYVVGTRDGDFTHPLVGSSAQLTANARSIYANDGG